jgi:arylsulfatase A-like enzyme
VDLSIGEMVAHLQKQGRLQSTLIVISAKHGQSPIDPNRFFPIPGPSGNNGQTPANLLASLLPESESPRNFTGIGPTEDDISLLWLADPSKTASAVGTLEANAAAAGISQIISGPTLSLLYNSPGLPPNGEPRTPDIIVVPNLGVVYTGSGRKLEEHGGVGHDDTNVMLLLSNPNFEAKTVTSPVETAQVAPTILKALELDPQKLESVRMEHVQVLPGLGFDDNDR